MNVLVAGIGNVFLGDDGFGVEVVHRLDPARLPADTDLADFGIRGVHLAYELLDGRYDSLVLVDAVQLGEPPGTLAVLDATGRAERLDSTAVEAHSMSPDVVLGALQALGGHVDRVVVVGCQPDRVDEGMELSPAVGAAVDAAVEKVLEVAHAERARRSQWMPSSC